MDANDDARFELAKQAAGKVGWHIVVTGAEQWYCRISSKPFGTNNLTDRKAVIVEVEKSDDAKFGIILNVDVPLYEVRQSGKLDYNKGKLFGNNKTANFQTTEGSGFSDWYVQGTKFCVVPDFNIEKVFAEFLQQVASGAFRSRSGVDVYPQNSVMRKTDMKLIPDIKFLVESLAEIYRTPAGDEGEFDTMSDWYGEALLADYDRILDELQHIIDTNPDWQQAQTQESNQPHHPANHHRC